MSCKCNHLIPWWDVGLGVEDRGDMPECILLDHHDGPHQFINDDGARISWQSEVCDDCDTPDDYCGCFVFWETKSDTADVET